MASSNSNFARRTVTDDTAPDHTIQLIEKRRRPSLGEGGTGDGRTAGRKRARENKRPDKAVSRRCRQENLTTRLRLRLASGEQQHRLVQIMREPALVLGLVVIRVQTGVRRRRHGQEASGEDHHRHQQQQTMTQPAQWVLLSAAFHFGVGMRKAPGPALQAWKPQA